MFEGFGEAWDGFMALPLWVKLLALIIAVGLILLLWQPWKSSSPAPAGASSGGGFLSSVVPGNPPSSSSPPPPPPPINPGVPPSPTPTTTPQLPAQVQSGSGWWAGGSNWATDSPQQQAAATAAAQAANPLVTPQGAFAWIDGAEYQAILQQGQQTYYEPVPGDFVALPNNSTAGLAPGTPLYIEEPSQANAQAG